MTKKGGWYKDSKGHSVAAKKGAKGRKKRKKGVPKLTNEVYSFRIVRDNKTGEIKGRKFIKKRKV
jgi:hypothetical protein